MLVATLRIASFAALLAVAAVACAPADVSGSYTVGLTNRENTCNYSNFNVGDMTPGVPFTIAQSGGAITGNVQGLAGIALAAGFGSAMFTGTVTGASINMTMDNPRPQAQGSCAYTWEVRVEGSLTGNALQGTVTYRPMTNHHPDCGQLEGCHLLQAFSGSRPPR